MLTPSLPFNEILLFPVGLKPYVPQKQAGILTDPAESVETENAAVLVEIATPSPPAEPPLPKPYFQGFLANP